MKTTWRQRQRFEDRLMKGRKPTVQECIDLVHDAHTGETLEQELEALKVALEEVGLHIVDTTTDDDGGTRVLEIIAIEAP